MLAHYTFGRKKKNPMIEASGACDYLTTSTPQPSIEYRAGKPPAARCANIEQASERSEQGLSYVSYLTATKDHARLTRYIDHDTGEVHEPYVTFWQGGSLLKVSRNIPGAPRQPGKRGKVDPTFSRSARRRMMRQLAMMERPTVFDAPLFVTLTYPGKEELWKGFDPTDWKRHLDTWGKRVLRAWPGAAAIWRLEPQKRGAPHFHLIIWGVWQGGIPRSIPAKRRWKALLGWISESWWEVVGSGDDDHLKAGTNCEVVENVKKMFYYASKYLAKTGDDTWLEEYGSVGRLWGVLGRDSLPLAEEMTVTVTPGEAVEIIRWARRFAGLKGRNYTTLNIYCDASFWHSKLSGVLT